MTLYSVNDARTKSNKYNVNKILDIEVSFQRTFECCRTDARSFCIVRFSASSSNLILSRFSRPLASGRGTARPDAAVITRRTWSY